MRAAVRNSGLTFLMKRITVNLAPADLKKEGPAYDLPIAVGILLSLEQLSADIRLRGEFEITADAVNVRESRSFISEVRHYLHG